MRRWDLLLVAAVGLVTLAGLGMDWRLGVLVLGVCLGAVWFWLGDVDEDG